MKKFLLTLAAAVIGLSAAAEDLTVDFATLTTTVAGSDTETKTVTVDDMVFTLENANSKINLNTSTKLGYVMLNSSTGAISFNLPYDCTSIIVTTTSGCSTNAENKLTLSVNGTKLEEKAVNATSTDFTFSLGTSGKSDAKCTFTATGSKNSQIQKLKFIQATTEPSIAIEQKSLSFANVKGGESTKTFNVTALNITEELSVSSDNAVFEVPAKVSVADAAAGIAVKFTGNDTETVSATVTVSYGSASASIAVNGIAVANAGTKENPLTVTDVITINSLLSDTLYVTGTIGDKCAANASNGVITQTETLTNTNILLTEGSAAIPVNLPSGDTRTALNIVDNPGNKGQTVIISGTLETYFGAPGVKNTKYISGLNENIKAADLEFSATTVKVELGTDFVAPVLTKATDAEATYSSSNEEVAKVDATTGKVEILAIGTAEITATTPQTDEYAAGKASYTITVIAPYEKATVQLATSISSGKYAIYTEKGVAQNYTGTNSYGYLIFEDVTVENNEFVVNADYLIEFTETDNGYTMLDTNNKYLGMNASNFGAFNFYDTADATGSNCYWTVTFDGDNVKIANTGREGAYISYKQYNTLWEIVTTDTAAQPLVQLFKVKEDSSTSVADLEVENTAEVEYYNLQGVRIANPEAGLYIKRQGTKATKVYVK